MAVTRQSLLDEIRASIDQQQAYANQSRAAYSGDWWSPAGASAASSAYNEVNKRNSLSQLLAAYDSSGGSEASTNPFSIGSGGGAPAVSTDNRFASGLTDVESRLRALLDNPDSIQQSGAYKFRVKQGEDALQRQMGAKGMLNSGNRLMELTKYGQDMASQEYDAQYGRLGNLLGNYTGGYTADKNANTNLFAAQSNAWNTAQGNADRNRLGFAQLNWEKSKPQFVSGGSRSSSGGSTFNAGGITGSWDPERDPGIARLRQASIDAANY